MKNKFFVFVCLAFGLGLAACDTDNYEAPESKLEGKIMYKGEPIYLGYNEVNMQLWEPGWQLRGAINVTVDQNGAYSARLFNAPYKLIIQPAQGPFRSITNPVTQSDTILIDLKGNQVLDIEVMPYYMVRNAQIASSARTVNASFRLEKIITDANAKNVERVSLYINKTMFVDRGNNIASRDLSGANLTDLNNISLSATVPAINPAQNYVFARVGVKIAGVEDMLYSAVQKIQL